ncbi:MAG: hypothetical protein KAT77_00695 [Nanoarchaeota archaeon]|nr:hypothetical protein [Nanoarchaeota archaeon]
MKKIIIFGFVLITLFLVSSCDLEEFEKEASSLKKVPSEIKQEIKSKDIKESLFQCLRCVGKDTEEFLKTSICSGTVVDTKKYYDLDCVANLVASTNDAIIDSKSLCYYASESMYGQWCQHCVAECYSKAAIIADNKDWCDKASKYDQKWKVIGTSTGFRSFKDSPTKLCWEHFGIMEE